MTHKIARPWDNAYVDQRQGSSTGNPALLGDKNRNKLDRHAWRLCRGDTLHMLPNGQFKFNGNKFVPLPVAQRLLPLCHPPHVNNRGWLCYVLAVPDARGRGA